MHPVSSVVTISILTDRERVAGCNMPSSETLIVTSFHPDHYDVYGRTFLETYTAHMTYPLVVYVERQGEFPDFEHELVTFRDLKEVNGMMQTLNLTNFPAARGKLWGGEELDYRFNVNGFCRKSFAQIDAAFTHQSEGGSTLYWFDADIEFSAHVEVPSVQDTFMVYLGRKEIHSCASFLGWNLNHPRWREFFNQYWAIYFTGTVFALNEWHDSFVVDFLRESLQLPAVNISEAIPQIGPYNVFDVVFSGAHHKKGALKNA